MCLLVIMCCNAVCQLVAVPLITKGIKTELQNIPDENTENEISGCPTSPEDHYSDQHGPVCLHRHAVKMMSCQIIDNYHSFISPSHLEVSDYQLHQTGDFRVRRRRWPG